MKIHKFIFVIIILLSQLNANAQEKEKSFLQKLLIPFLDKLFVPSLQIGWMEHNSNFASGGFMYKSSLEYRTQKNYLFRINYDDISGRIKKFELPNKYAFAGRIRFSELAFGAGYRKTYKKHNLFGLTQISVRFYETPDIETQHNELTFRQKQTTVLPIRYTIGYEYEFMRNSFFNIEFFTGHFLRSKDYWTNQNLYWGATFGVSTKFVIVQK